MRKIKEYLSLFLSYNRAYKQQKAEIDFHARDLAFLVPHAKKNISRYTGLFLLLLLSSGLSLPGPAITGYIVDKVFVRKDASKLDLLVSLLLAILLLSELVRIVQEYAMLRTSQEFTYSIRVHLIERMLRYPLSFFKDFQTGYLVSRLDEVNLLGSFFSITIPSVAENLVRFVGAVFLISRYNLKLTLIAMIILPLFIEIVYREVGAIRTTRMLAMEKIPKEKKEIQETLSRIDVIKRTNLHIR